MEHERTTTARSQFIVYLCPNGPLDDQIERFFLQSKNDVGENKAHAYMPHCTLTGFFWDKPAHSSLYIPFLKSCFENPTQHNVEITQIIRKLDFLGLEIQANGIQQLVLQFAATAKTPGLQEAIRTKEWLHLSLAYGFPPEHFAALDKLVDQINTKSPVGWEIRFYERDINQNWSLHWSTIVSCG